MPAVALALGLGACGDDTPSHEASSEAAYVDVGHMQYQVQISRQLNPEDVEDKSYFNGIPASEMSLGQDEVWFGVFLRILNVGDATHDTASDFEVVDTQGKTYKPLEYARPNPLAYDEAQPVPADDVYPPQGSIAEQGPTEGKLLLFKITLDSIENRPLVLKIHDPDAPFEVNRIDLDV